MMWKATVAVCVLGLAALVFAPGCKTKPGGAAKTKGKIGVTCMDLENPFFKLISNVMAEEAGKYGYEIISLSAGNDPAEQNKHISNFVSQGCDAIFLNPADSKAAGQGVKNAHEAGIPVFTYDVQVTDEEATELVTSHIGSDNYQGGQLAAESMMKVTGDSGKIAVIGYPEVTSCILRVDGFKDYLKEKKSNLQIVTELSGKGARDSGHNTAADILVAHPGIVGIFAINDPSGLGAYAAVLEASKQDKITVIAFDASPAGKQAVFEKKLYDTPQQFPRKMAKDTVAAFVKFLEGEEVEKKIFIPCAHYYYEDSVKDPSREKEQW